MASYWIVVPRGNSELFDLLSVAFRGQRDFSVIVDRRAGQAAPLGTERRGNRDDLGPDEIIVAERAERADRSAKRSQRHGSRAIRNPGQGSGVRRGSDQAPTPV